MKKGILSIAALSVVLLISFTSLSVKPAATATEKTPAAAVSQEKVLGARFLNMLNHNFVYNDAFDSVYEMTACSEVAVLDKAENGYISESVISGYLYNMYGVENADFAAARRAGALERRKAPAVVILEPRAGDQPVVRVPRIDERADRRAEGRTREPRAAQGQGAQVRRRERGLQGGEYILVLPDAGRAERAGKAPLPRGLGQQPDADGAKPQQHGGDVRALRVQLAPGGLEKQLGGRGVRGRGARAGGQAAEQPRIQRGQAAHAGERRVAEDDAGVARQPLPQGLLRNVQGK